jgi:hypothetical protein
MIRSGKDAHSQARPTVAYQSLGSSCHTTLLVSPRTLLFCLETAPEFSNGDKGTRSNGYRKCTPEMRA